MTSDFRRDIPAYARAVMDALQFRLPNPGPLSRLSETEWDRALSFCDQTMLTLPVGLRGGTALPARVRERIDADLQKNAERWRRTQVAYREIADALNVEGIEFTLLKGFSQCPCFVRDPRHRSHGDIDLLFKPADVLRARDVAKSLGYEPLRGFEDFPIDHLPRMLRKSSWQWQGDYFDMEMPLSIELHFRLWDAGTEGFRPEGIEDFRERCSIRELEGTVFPALHDADALGYSTLHILRHLLRGDLRPSHVYELAAFLHWRALDSGFWTNWRELHPVSLRRLEAIGFGLAERWFDCQLSPAAIEEIERLPPDTARWVTRWALAPLAALFHPNKEEVWLHWTLLHSFRDRRRMLIRRLWPGRVPRFVPYPSSEEIPAGCRMRVKQASRKWLFLATRLRRHVLSVAATAHGAVRWFAANAPSAE